MWTIVICPNCGKNTPEGKFCEHCGASVGTTQTFQQPVVQQPVYTQQPAAAKSDKNAGIAAILSLLFPGAGQAHNGQILKGIGFFIGVIVTLFISPYLSIIVRIYGLYDAYSNSNKMNKGEIPYAASSTGAVIGFVIIGILIVVLIVFIGSLALMGLWYNFFNLFFLCSCHWLRMHRNNPSSSLISPILILEKTYSATSEAAWWLQHRLLNF